jgi:hypothetical protein
MLTSLPVDKVGEHGSISSCGIRDTSSVGVLFPVPSESGGIEDASTVGVRGDSAVGVLSPVLTVSGGISGDRGVGVLSPALYAGCEAIARNCGVRYRGSIGKRRNCGYWGSWCWLSSSAAVAERSPCATTVSAARSGGFCGFLLALLSQHAFHTCVVG